MNFELSYCPNVEYILGRLRKLYDREAQDQIFTIMDVPTLTMEKFAREHQPGYCNYPDPFERIAFWDSYLHERKKVHDDSIPSAYMTEMDQGLYGGLIGGEVQFLCDTDTAWISSMVAPILKNISEFEQIEIDTDNKWFQCYINQLDIFVKKSAGKFCISHFILIDSLNFVFELFGGTDTYLYLVEQPELIQRAIDFAFDLTRATFWVVLLGGLANNLISYSSDQAVIQRYLTTKNEKEAAKGLWFNGTMSIVISLIFYFIGTTLYALYKTQPQELNIAMENPDSIFPHFIMTRMPIGIAGLLIAAIFSASMSTVSSNVNSIPTAALKNSA